MNFAEISEVVESTYAQLMIALSNPQGRSPDLQSHLDDLEETMAVIAGELFPYAQNPKADSILARILDCQGIITKLR